jgi:type IV secretion system protein VirB6
VPTSLIAPFTAIDLAYTTAFNLYLNSILGAMQAALAGPLLACVTLWIIVQGILVMRGDIDTRHGLTKIVTVALVFCIVSSSSLYQDNVQALFETAIPSMIQQLGGNIGVPTTFMPTELDIIFRAGEVGFQKVAAEIPPGDELDALAFQGAQFFFYFTLWSIFAIYDMVSILTSVLVGIGPLFIIGFLFEATKGIAFRWVGQMISYAILLLLISIVATVVVATIALFMTATFVTTIAVGTTAGQLIGLYELDLFIMTGCSLVLALPMIAASIGGGVGAQGMQLGQSIYRQFAGGTSTNTIRNMGMIQ